MGKGVGVRTVVGRGVGAGVEVGTEVGVVVSTDTGLSQFVILVLEVVIVGGDNELLVIVIMQTGMFSTPVFLINSFNFSTSILPLKSAFISGCVPSSFNRSIASASENSIFACVVS